MKPLKIIIALAVVNLIGYAAYTYIGPIIKPPLPPEDVLSNALKVETETKIDSIKKLSPNKFYVDYYNKILGDIVYYANEGKIDSSNKDQLLKDLEFEYHKLFILQANYVFDNNQWSQNDLNIIKNERNRLSNSNYIDVKTQLNSIKTVLDNYNNLMRFISETRDFSNQTEEIISLTQRFDSLRTASYIKIASNYLTRTDLTRNCNRINTSLNNISKEMYQKHLRYLANKVSFTESLYLNYDSHTEYYNSVYLPVYKEINNFEKSYSLYKVGSFSRSRDDTQIIRDLLRAQNKKALTHFPN